MNLPTIRLVAALALAPAAAAAVPEIHNPGSAPVRRTVACEEAWRAGADQGAPYLFGVVRAAVAGPDGSVYLLDTQQQQVLRFAADGRYLGLVTRRGDGPGEIRLVNAMLMLEDGRLGLLKVFPAALVTVEPDGRPGPVIRFAADTAGAGSFASLGALAARDGYLVGSGNVFGGAAGTDGRSVRFVAGFGPDGTQRRLYARCPGGHDLGGAVTVDERADHCDHGLWALGAGGELYRTVARDDPVLEVLGPDGAPRRRIRFAREPHRRSAAERAAARDRYVFNSTGPLPPITFVMADTDPAFTSLRVVGDELWIGYDELERRLPAGVAARLEVCDLEGHLKEERSIALPLDRGRDRLILLDDGRAVRITAYREATAAAAAGRSRQVGAGRAADEPAAGGVPEVIVYRPAAETEVAEPPDPG